MEPNQGLQKHPEGISRQLSVPRSNVPISDIDPYSDEALIDPWEV
jgi:hypothetical protein